MTWLKWSLKLHSGLKTFPHLIHTQHTRFLFNECLFHLCDCTCSNVMCILNCLSIKPNMIFEYFIYFWKCFYAFVFWFFVYIVLFMFFIKNSLRGIFAWRFASKLFLQKWERLNLKTQFSDRNFCDCLTR